MERCAVEAYVPPANRLPLGGFGEGAIGWCGVVFGCVSRGRKRTWVKVRCVDRQVRMAEEQSKGSEIRMWFTENKLKAVGGLWAASVIGSFAYNFSNPNMKTSVKVIHARLHAQALTLAALAGSAAVEYYDHQSGEKAMRYEKHVQ